MNNNFLHRYIIFNQTNDPNRYYSGTDSTIELSDRSDDEDSLTDDDNAQNAPTLIHPLSLPAPLPLPAHHVTSPSQLPLPYAPQQNPSNLNLFQQAQRRN